MPDRKKEKEEALRKYKKFLKKIGYNPTERKENKEKRTITTHKKCNKIVSPNSLYPSLCTGLTPCTKPIDEGYKQAISSRYEIGQTYNKGNFQVLTKKESQSDATGKRRS